MVPTTGIEPVSREAVDFESTEFTSFSTRASSLVMLLQINKYLL